MRFLVRWAFRFFILLLVVTIAIVLLKDMLLKAFTEHCIRSQTGMDVKIGKFEVGLFSPTLTIENLTLYNPAEFGGSPFLDVSDLYLECDARALATRQLHLRLVRLSLTELNIVEGKDGRTNLVLSLDGLNAPSNGAQRESILGLEFKGIDTLNLSLGTVRYTSLRRPGKGTEIKLRLKNEVITNVRSITDLNHLLMKVLLRNGITIVTPSPWAR
jgi:hypothetical protein